MDQTKKIKILLLTFRRFDLPGANDLERFSATTGLAAEQFVLRRPTDRELLLSDLLNIDAIMIGGSNLSLTQEVPLLSVTQEVLLEAKKLGLPMFGACFGHQLLAATFGGEVVREDSAKEYGSYEIHLTDDAKDDALFSGLPKSFPAHCGHWDRVSKLPESAIILARSEKCDVHAFTLPGTGIYGVQFHPEHSVESFQRILREKGHSFFSQDAEVATSNEVLPTPDASSLLERFVTRVVTSGRVKLSG